MNGFRGNLFKIVIVVLFGLATFFPPYGLAYLDYSLFQHGNQPLLATFFAAVWLILFALFLPLPVHIFRIISTVSIAFIAGLGIYVGWTAHFVDPGTANFWLTWGVGVVFALIGWLLAATPLWRFFHGVVAVQNVEPGHHG